MCDIGERADVWNERFRVARKEHECMGCPDPILPGHQYRIVTSLYDGSWDTQKHCLRCAAMIDAIYDRAGENGDWDLVVDPELNCGETWVDPPEHVAALAFWLPGDPIQSTRKR